MIRTLLAALAIVPLILAAPAPAPADAQAAAGTYRIVPDSTAARMTVRSFVGTIRAEMPPKGGSITLDGNGRVTGGSAVFDATRISGPADAVKRLLSGGDGLDVQRFPEIRFVATAGRIEGGRAVLEGNLTIKGTTRQVRFDGDAVREGQRGLSARLEATIDRTAFGVTAGRPIYSRNAELRIRLGMTRR